MSIWFRTSPWSLMFALLRSSSRGRPRAHLPRPLRGRPSSTRRATLRAAAVRARDHLEQVAVGVGEVHAAPAVVVVDLPGVRAAGIGPVRDMALEGAAMDLLEVA